MHEAEALIIRGEEKLCCSPDHTTLVMRSCDRRAATVPDIA